jgi:hypothetical protein
MGSIVKSIGKTIKKVVKKVGRFVKKNAPYILLAAAMWAGMGAYGASLGTSGTANIFSWTNVKAGASALGSNVMGAFSGGGQPTATSGVTSGQILGEQVALGTGTPPGTSILEGDMAGAMGGGTSEVAAGTRPYGMGMDQTVIPGFPTQAYGQYGGLNYLSQGWSPSSTLSSTLTMANAGSAIGGAGGGGLFNSATSFIKGIVANAAEKQPALLLATMAGMGSEFLKAFGEDEELALAKQALEQKYTFAGFKPGEGRTPDEMPADSPFWANYNQNQKTQNQFVHGLRQPTMGRQAVNYNYKPRGVVQQRTAQTLTDRPQGMINFNNPGVLNG